MGILRWFKKKFEIKKKKKFSFEASGASCIGDLYHYKIEAENKEEAFKKLVEYFYGSDGMILGQNIESEQFDVVYPTREVFEVKNMPSWFGRLILGRAKEGDMKILEEYCKKNNINLQTR